MTAAAWAVSAPAGDSFVIRAKAVYPVTPDEFGPIENGMIVVRDGKIVAVGRDLPVPADLRLIEYRDETIIPGLVDAAGSLAGAHGGDESVAAGYHALDAFDTYADHKALLLNGTTTMHLDTGGHRLVSGQGSVVKLAGPPHERVLRPQADLTVNFGVFGPPRKWDFPFYASPDDPIVPAVRQRPGSRLGQFLELEYRIADAKALLERGDLPAAERAKFDMHAIAFAAAWRENLPLRIHVRHAVDIEGGLSVLKRHGRAGYLVGLTEGDQLNAALLESGVAAVLRIETAYRKTDLDLGPDPDVLEARLRTAGRLQAAKIALSGPEGDDAYDLRLVAALAVRGGLSPRMALEGVTRTPAEILGVDARVGSLAAGKDADFLVLSGLPLGISSHIRNVFVNGEAAIEVPASDALIVKAGTIWTGTGTVIHDGAILIEDGKIRAVGGRVPHPRFARVIDAGPNGFVSPGFIDAHGHLGLERDQTTATADMSLAATIGVAGREFVRVARAGVTTVMLAAYRTGGNGSRVAAIKTYGQSRDDMVIRDMSALKFSLRRGDPLTAVEQIVKVIKAGQAYDKKWTKYAEDLKKWEEAKAQGKTVEADPDKPDADAEKDETKPDPITGTWEVTAEGAPLPEPITTKMVLKLNDDNTIEGRLFPPEQTGSDEDIAISGRLEGDQVTLELDIETPLGAPTANATLDHEDHMSGALVLGPISIDFEATRVDKSAVEFSIKRRRKSRKDGKPQPPKIDHALEPVRKILSKKAPLLVETDSAAQINSVLETLVDEYKLRVVLLNARESTLHADKLREANVGVVVPAEITRRRNRKPYTQAADLTRKGVTVALQSDAEDGARNLPLMGLYAVRQGMGGDAALSALTVDVAKMYGIDDRVGSLEAGKDADLLIFTGHPFDEGSRLERVIVAGREVPDE